MVRISTNTGDTRSDSPSYNLHALQWQWQFREDGTLSWDGLSGEWTVEFLESLRGDVPVGTWFSVLHAQDPVE